MHGVVGSHVSKPRNVAQPAWRVQGLEGDWEMWGHPAGKNDDGPPECGAIEQIRSARALCPTTVLVNGNLVSSYLRRLSLRFLLAGSSPPQTGRMDPAGLEPASATWTECCAPIAPRALYGVSGATGNVARLTERFFLTTFRIGNCLVGAFYQSRVPASFIRYN